MKLTKPDGAAVHQPLYYSVKSDTFVYVHFIV